jgi:hypothetical protein
MGPENNNCPGEGWKEFIGLGLVPERPEVGRMHNELVTQGTTAASIIQHS